VVSPTALLKFGSPSWTHIEPCVSLHSRSFGSYSSKRETYELRHRTVVTRAASRDDPVNLPFKTLFSKIDTQRAAIDNPRH